MTTKTKSPKVAARTPGTPGTKKSPTAAPVNQRLRREAQAAVAANIARLDADGDSAGATAADHNEQGGDQQPAKPAPEVGKDDKPGTGGKPGKGTKKPVKPAAKGAKPAKAQVTAKTPKAPKVKRLSCLDAAAQIIGKNPIGCKDLIAEMQSRKLWSSPNGKTPDASLYAAIIREIAARKGEARFKKVDRGLFVANPAAPGTKKGA